ncbi:MAG: type I DNA topoisomerase [SAR202 cluster bacterium]|nr:type I DNA topoisomerase [SAR202 cluster bacterium]
MPDLVIVESPAKARTVGRFLGKKFSVKASMGHVRDLPRRKLGVEINEDSFIPTYTVSVDKRKVVAELKKAAADAEIVYLATDPDREGEAIAWHLLEAAKIDLDKARRVVFHEITESAIEEAFSNPRNLDTNLVNAQQARRILDRLVGYELSPVLWSKVKKGTSAGRVQSVAVRMVVDREKEIGAFNPKEFWTLQATFSKRQNELFTASLNSVNGKKPDISTKASSDEIIGDLDSSNFSVSSYETKESRRRPAAPFITSTLQQEASRRLRYSASRTMTLAQQLYEGIESSGADQTGLITYMRTDSTNVAASALSETATYINDKYGAGYIPETPRVYSKRVRGAQEAHEAIRPTSIFRTPASLRSSLNGDQFRLYDLIWKRMVASQMTDALYDRTVIDVSASGVHSGREFGFRATGLVPTFDGFRILYTEGRDDVDDSEEDERGLPILKKNDDLKCESLSGEQKFTQPPPRYTEPTLIRSLEKEGIGRPSTYASIIGTIQDRDYVRKDVGRFVPTKLGIVVTEFLQEYFENIMDIGFTAEMEKKLDDIAEGDEQWNPMLLSFYEPFDISIGVAKEKAQRVDRSKLDEETDQVCEQCERPMVIRGGRNGRFIACTGFPDCKNTKPLLVGVKCPECVPGGLAERKSRRGVFYGCTNYPDCKFAVNTMPLSQPCPDCDGLLLPARGQNARCASKECGYRGPAPVDETSRREPEPEPV